MLDAILKGAGALVDAGVNWLWGEKQEDMQAKFARNAIQWKVKDAQKAGVHPLYALGAPTMNYSPVSLGGASDFAGAGQDIGRALGAGLPKEAQLTLYQKTAQDLQLKGFALDNEYKAAQIARLKNELLQKPAVPPVTLSDGSRLIPGQSSTAQVAQDQYGDVVENVYGLGRLEWDALTNLDNWLSSPGKSPVVRSRGPTGYRQAPRYPSYNYSKTGRR